jgi:hypothetical protein
MYLPKHYHHYFFWVGAVVGAEEALGVDAEPACTG